MEGTPENRSRLVHVLRHRFEPTEILAAQVKLILERHARQEKLKFFGTRIAVLDGVNYHNHRYEEETKDIEWGFEHRRTPIYLNGRVSLRRIENVRNPESSKARIGLQPLSQAGFNGILSGFNQLPSLRPDGYSEEHPEGQHVKHFIYTDVSESAILHSPEGLRLALSGFRGAVSLSESRPLHSLRPLEIVGHDMPIAWSQKDEAIAAAGRKVEPWERDGLAS